MESTTLVPSGRDDSEAEGHSFYRMFLIHHTHWDREWWATYQDFRIRLVDLVDGLLDTLDADPEFASFLLDGQTVVLRDYLEIRPENRERLVRCIRSGRIECGPWHILPDEFLVSGEAHIRNLWLGRRTSRNLDVPLLSVGYIPDTFGHISQMPQILRGFGIDNAFLWRGRGGDAETVKQEFLWRAPDGSAVLAHWFPNGYYQMPFLHFGNPDRPYEDKLGRIYQAIEDFGARATADILLLPYGGDHRPIDPALPAKIREANEQISDVGEVTWATAQKYIDAVRAADPRLETVTGELRGCAADSPHMLSGVLSARLYLKRLNHTGQVWLERLAEPMSAVAWLAGGTYETSLLWKAWELLVQNHPHDSICGCSIDQVHREMLPRFDQSRQIAQIITGRAAGLLDSGIDTSDFRAGDRAVVVRNTLPRTRSEWTTVWVARDDSLSYRTHLLLDSQNVEVPFQVGHIEGTAPTTDRYLWTEIGFVAQDVPGLGYRTYRLTEREIPLDTKQVSFTARHPVARFKGSEQVTDLSVDSNELENRWLRVEVDAQTGALTITDKRSGQVYAGLNTFEDGGDAGDTYNYSAPLGDLIRRSAGEARVHVSVAEAGFARSTLRIDLHWLLPESLSADRLSRSPVAISTRLSTFVSLTEGVPRVDVETEWDNVTRDHRLRALFPLGAPTDRSFALGHFSVEERPVNAEVLGNGWPEPLAPTMPNSGWISAGVGSRGLAIANQGLTEYELLSDGTLALTVLRAVGWLSREDILSRVGGAGPTIPTPDAQCLGPNRASYSIIPYDGDWLRSGSYVEASSYHTPPFTTEAGVHPGEAPLDGGLIELEGDHTLVVSAVKKAEDADHLILRVWNAGGERTEGRLRLGKTPRSVFRADLREDAYGERLALDESGRAIVVAGPAEIVTIGVQF